MSTLLLYVTWLTTPASAMMTVTAMLRTSATQKLEYVSWQFVWQIQSVMGLIKYAMINMITATIVERMTALTTLMDVVQVRKYENSQHIHDIKFITGCHDSALNCEYPAPVCDLASHTCKCNDDSDCHAEDFCNNDGVCELYVCLADTECDGFDQICNAQHDNCFYCGQDDCPHHTDGCCPGTKFSII